MATHSSNLSYLPTGSDEAVRNALVDPNAFRGSRMAHLKSATDKLRAQIDGVVASNRADVINAIEGRKAELDASAYYVRATTRPRRTCYARVDQTISRVRAQSQVALIRETGASFERPSTRVCSTSSPPRNRTRTRRQRATPEADRIH